MSTIRESIGDSPWLGVDLGIEPWIVLKARRDPSVCDEQDPGGHRPRRGVVSRQCGSRRIECQILLKPGSRPDVALAQTRG